MKKFGKIRKHGLVITAMFACFALIATCISFLTPVRAHAEDPVAPYTLVKFFGDASVQLPLTVKYGDPIVIDEPTEAGITAKIFAPNGKDVTPTAASGKYTVKATQVGSYRVVYSEATSGAKREFSIKVDLEDKLFIRLKEEDDKYIKSNMNINESFTFPKAYVVYYDENNIIRNYEGDVALTVNDGAYDPFDDTKNKFTATTNGKFYFTYVASIGNGGKCFSKTFTTNVTSTYNDTTPPQITVSGVSSTVSVNRPFTLPKATATDDYDTDVRIKITVTDKDGEAVKVTDVDEYGYAIAPAADAPAVDFDNDKAMTFYPVKEGPYTVTYVAIDDKGQESTKKVFTPTASDSYAPVFQEIDDWQIPEKWGLNVSGKSENRIAMGGKIKMPMPLLVDNKDHMPDYSAAVEGEEEDTAIIKLYFRVTDSDRSTTIVEFKNILAKDDSDDCKFTPNSTYGTGTEPYVFNQNNEFVFDFALYNRKDAAGNATTDKAGTYTVYYRAEDQAGNRSTKTYTVTLTTDYEDKEDPTTVDVNVPKYVSYADDSLMIPSPAVADAADSRPHVEYTIYSMNAGADKATAASLKVKGGEKAEFVYETEGNGEALYLVINKDKSYAKKLKLGDTMYFFVKVTDSVGNVKSNAADPADFTTCTAVTKVVPKTVISPVKYNDEIKFTVKNSEGEWDDVDGSTVVIHADDKVNAGRFYIETSEDMRKYTGFEVSVTDKNGAALNTTLETTTIYGVEAMPDKALICVNNITFVPGAAGVHFLNVRVFDVNNNNWVYTYKFDVAESTHGGGTVMPSATVIPSNGSVEVKYNLHEITKNENGIAGHVYYLARKISGGVYSLMGSEFVAKSQGSYSVTDGLLDLEVLMNGDYKDFGNVSIEGNDGGTYSFSITDTASPVIEILGAMPTYADVFDDADENAKPVKLPVMFAYSDNGKADIDVTVKFDKDGKEIDVDFDEAAQQYSFKPYKDGKYTVTVTATRAKATPVTATYTVNVGKVTPPQFDVGALSIKLKQGEKFNYADIVLAEGESSTGLKVTAKILDPAKDEVSGATINCKFDDFAKNKENYDSIVLDKSGVYHVYYYVEDELGNGSDTPIIVEVTVSAAGSNSATTFTTLSIVLIVVAVVLLAGVIVYVVRFRKVKK